MMIIRAFAILLLPVLTGFAAFAATTNVPVVITVTHPPTGGVITTATWTNYSSATMPAGTPVHFAQAWRYGDIMPGFFPSVQDASTHTPLAYQWDEIDTAHENGGNGSWKHSVGIARLAASLASGASVQFEFILNTGTYSQPQVVALSALCSGSAAHDLKIHLTDVRNQDDSTRATGDATFDLCANINNTGRDAPRILGAGSVRTEAQIMGQFVYTNATKDPLLYVMCNVGLYVTQETEWVCHVMSPWMNVAAGTVGNAGAPGPVGLANDPQIISYRAEVDDGATDVLDWHGFDTTLQSPNSPVISCPENYGGGNCINVPSSTGLTTWYWPMAVRVTSCTGTCLGGLTQGQFAWAYPSGIVAARFWPTALSTQINLLATPQLGATSAGTSVLNTSQGTGSTTFQHRFWHTKWATWHTMDTSADENWSPSGSATRTTRRFYPQFTTTEQNYWKQTGLVPPLLVPQASTANIRFDLTASPALYEPLGRENVIGGTGTSFRADIGIVSDYAGQAFITQAQSDWFNARLFSMGAEAHGWMGILNEVTGRIPPVNNGPPGSGGFGVGTAYSQLGAPFPNVATFPFLSGMVQPLQNVPNSNFDWAGGMWNQLGTYISHTPAFGSLSYIIWGEQHFLDMMRWNGNHDIIQTYTYNSEPQNLSYGVRNPQLQLTGGPGPYNCNVMYQGQNRGSAWALRDVILPAAMGGDNEQERQYYNDCITENANSYPSILNFMNGMTPGAVQAAALPPNIGGTGGTQAGVDVFVYDYMFLSTYQLQTLLHSPMATAWLPVFTRWYQVLLGGGTVPNSLDPFYGVDYTSSPAVHNGDCVFAGAVTGGNIGGCFNSTDGSDMGGFGLYTTYTSGSGMLKQNLSGGPPYILTVGDTIKAVGPAFTAQPAEAVDQLHGNTWYKILGPIDNVNGTYFVENPATPGVAFTQFTRNGAPFSESNGSIIYRPQHVPAPTVQGFANSGYCAYARQTLAGLTILGQDVSVPTTNFTFRLQGNINNCGAQGNEPILWDSSVVVPGSSTTPPPPPPPPNQPPAQAAAAGFTTLAFNSDFSQPQYANALNNSWLCNRTTDDGSHVCQWYYGIWWSGAVALDGDGNNTVGQVFDPTIGQNVLEMTWKKAYCPAFFATPSQCTAAFQVIETVSLADQGEAITPQLASAFPSNNAYIEWRYRDNNLSLLDGNDTSALVWWARCAFNSNTCGAIGGSSFNEIDIDENYANHCGDGGGTGICAQSLQACHGWGGATCSGGMANATWVYPTIGNPNFNNYHTYGVLITSAGGGTATECSFIDNVRQGCLPFQNGDAANRSSLEMAGGMTTFGSLVPSTNDQHIFIQYVRVWSCPAWNTTDPARQCNQVIPPNGPNQLGPTWVANGATPSSTTAPNGSPAVLATQTTATGVHAISQNSAYTNATSIFQVNIAPGAGQGATNIALDVSGGSNFAGASFNPTTGAVTGTFVDSPASQVVAANATAIAGNCSPAPNCGYTAYVVVSLGSAPTSVNVVVGANGAGDGSSSAKVWDWFFESGQTPIVVTDAVGFCPANGGGNGSAGSPWQAACIQAAVNASPNGGTVELAAGNWELKIANAPVITGNKSVNLVGAGSGNTFDAFGHPNNGTGGPVGPVTRIFTSGASGDGGGYITFGIYGQNLGTNIFGCSNGNPGPSVSHIYIDGSQAQSAGNAFGSMIEQQGNFNGTLSFQSCPNATVNDIRLLSWTGGPVLGVNSPNAQFWVRDSSNFVLQNSALIEYFDGTSYGGVQLLQDQEHNTSTLTNNLFYMFGYNPIFVDNVTYTANTTVMSCDTLGCASALGGFGEAGCTPSFCYANGGSSGTLHFHIINNYFNSTSQQFGMGGGVNDPNTSGVVNDLQFTGDWLIASDASVGTCEWRLYTDSCLPRTANSSGMQVNNMSLTNSSVIGSSSAAIDFRGNGCPGPTNANDGTGPADCPGSTQNELQCVGCTATNDYLQGPHNQYLIDSNSPGAVRTNTFCSGSTFSGCNTTGFTTPPTAAFTLGLLSGGAVPFATTSFTAQYGAVKWLASVSSMPPATSDPRWNFLPPVSLAATHGSAVNLWVMDSVNHISAPATAVVN